MSQYYSTASCWLLDQDFRPGMGYASLYIQQKSALAAGRVGAGDDGASAGASAHRAPAPGEHRPTPSLSAAAVHGNGGNCKVEAWLGRAAPFPTGAGEAEREEMERIMRRETQASCDRIRLPGDASGGARLTFILPD